MPRLKTIFILPFIFLSLLGKSQDKGIQFETKLITAFMQREEADSNIISEDYDTILIGCFFKTNKCKVFYYTNQHLINSHKIDTNHLDYWFHTNGHIFLNIGSKLQDTLSLLFSFKNITSFWGRMDSKIGPQGNISILNMDYHNKTKDTLYKYYANFRKDSLANLGLRDLYHYYFDEDDFIGLNPKRVVKLLGKPNSIDTVGTTSSPNRYAYIYNFDTNESSINKSANYLFITIENNTVVTISETHYVIIESTGTSMW